MFNLIPSNGKHVAATAHSTHSLWMTLCMILFFCSLSICLVFRMRKTKATQPCRDTYRRPTYTIMARECDVKRNIRMVAAQAPLRLKEIVNASWRWCLASVFAHSASSHAMPCMYANERCISDTCWNYARAPGLLDVRFASGDGVDATLRDRRQIEIKIGLNELLFCDLYVLVKSKMTMEKNADGFCMGFSSFFARKCDLVLEPALGTLTQWNRFHNFYWN